MKTCIFFYHLEMSFVKGRPLCSGLAVLIIAVDERPSRVVSVSCQSARPPGLAEGAPSFSWFQYCLRGQITKSLLISHHSGCYKTFRLGIIGTVSSLYIWQIKIKCQLHCFVSFLVFNSFVNVAKYFSRYCELSVNAVCLPGVLGKPFKLICHTCKQLPSMG